MITYKHHLDAVCRWTVSTMTSMLLFMGENGTQYRGLVCYAPDTDNKSICAFNFAAFTRGLYLNSIYLRVDYRINTQIHNKTVQAYVEFNLLSIFALCNAYTSGYRAIIQ